MANHGVVTYGENLLHAYMNMETVEHFARIALVVHQLGRQQLLSGEDVNKLMAAREKYEATRNSALATKPGNGGNGAAGRRGRAVRRQA
jgi:L-fuculose-phosphate aldolase